MRIKQIIFLLAVFLPWITFSAAEKVVHGTYTYYIPYNVSRDKAEQIALERAMIQAIAEEFGTVLTRHSRMEMRSSKDTEYEDFWLSASSLVKGEWVKTIGTPTFKAYVEDGNFVIKCEVKGLAREVKSAKAALDVKLLRNGTSDAHQSSSFASGDKCYLAFTTPVKGALAVYLEDENKTVSCMLPYYSQSETCIPVSAGERHLYFTNNDGDNEQYVLLTDKEIEHNLIYVLFSRHEFIKPIDRSSRESLSLKTLSSEDFHKWLTKAGAMDADFQVVTIPITICSKFE